MKKINLRNGLLRLRYLEDTVHHGKKKQQATGQPPSVARKQVESNECLYSAPFLFSIQSWTQPYGFLLPVFSMSLPISVNPISNFPQEI